VSLNNQRAVAHNVADAVLALIDQYGTPEHMNGKTSASESSNSRENI
jgi:hypothetical protein